MRSFESIYSVARELLGLKSNCFSLIEQQLANMVTSLVSETLRLNGLFQLCH